MAISEITTLLVEQENQNLGVLRKQCPLVTLVMHDFFGPVIIFHLAASTALVLLRVSTVLLKCSCWAKLQEL